MAKKKVNPRGVKNVEHTSPVGDESATTKYAKDVEHTSPVRDESATTKYAKDIEHISPVSDEKANTKYAKDVEHTSPVRDESATTKYAKDVEHMSPVGDEKANTKYAKDTPSSNIGNQSLKRLHDLSLEETITNFKNQVERNFSDYSNEQKIEILNKIIEVYGISSLEINVKYFKDKY